MENEIEKPSVITKAEEIIESNLTQEEDRAREEEKAEQPVEEERAAQQAIELEQQ